MDLNLVSKPVRAGSIVNPNPPKERESRHGKTSRKEANKVLFSKKEGRLRARR